MSRVNRAGPAKSKASHSTGGFGSRRMETSVPSRALQQHYEGCSRRYLPRVVRKCAQGDKDLTTVRNLSVTNGRDLMPTNQAV